MRNPRYLEAKRVCKIHDTNGKVVLKIVPKDAQKLRYASETEERKSLWGAVCSFFNWLVGR